MKSFIILSAVLALTGCGSFGNVLESNAGRKTEHVKFQINRLSLIQSCYQAADTESMKHGCQLLQAQLQTEQGFTVRPDLDALPTTPEEQALALAKFMGTLGIADSLIKSTVKGLQRTNEIVTVKEPYEIEKPVIVQVPAGTTEVPIAPE